jgi:complex iron-sulfur molybdoenzyme family reductase subunit gamma
VVLAGGPEATQTAWPGASHRRQAEGASINRAAWDDGRWTVVVSRPLKAKGADNVKLNPGKAVKVGFSVWDGGNAERGDLRSYSRQWRELTLEA